MDTAQLLVTVAAFSLGPLALIAATSFVKCAVVLGFLRDALGLARALPTLALTAIAALLSVFIMAPVAESTVDAARPWLERAAAEAPSAPDVAPTPNATPEAPALPAWDIATWERAVSDVSAPWLAWLQRHGGEGETRVLVSLAETLRGDPQPSPRPRWTRDHPLIVLPAFALTELREAFMIGFLVLLPFLVLDLVVASALQSVSLTTLQPSTVSLPFKLLLFVMIDGWTLLTQGLILGYAPVG